jgi:hypothetical protein
MRSATGQTARRSAQRAVLAATAMAVWVSMPTALVAQTTRVSIGKAANQLSVSMYADSAVVALSGPDPEGGGIATARLISALPEARIWATSALAAISSCRADQTRLQHATTLYDHAARNDSGEGRFPSAVFACGRGRRGELATIDVAMTSNFTTSLLFTSYSEAQSYFQRVVKALPPNGSTHSKL